MRGKEGKYRRGKRVHGQVGNTRPWEIREAESVSGAAKLGRGTEWQIPTPSATGRGEQSPL